MANELHLYGKGAVTISGAGGLADFESYGMPVLYLWGDLNAINKDDAGTFTYKYGDNTGTSTLKWQGATSVGFPKKNFTWNKISTPFEAKEGWGVQKKYCLKANYIDPTHARNIMCARLWGSIVASRDTVPAELAACPNYGAVDGFPIILVINDEFHGLYTLNIPKDTWMFAMEDGWLIQTENGSLSTLNGTQQLVMDDESDFSLQENPGDDDESVVKETFQRMIDAVLDCDGSDWSAVETCLDIPSVIDYMCFSALTANLDGINKNVLYATYDKTKFYMSAYDMDSTFGKYWNGKRLVAIRNRPTLYTGWDAPIFKKIIQYRKSELTARYKEIRYSLMSDYVIDDQFSRWTHAIPLAVLNADSAKWGEMYGTAVDGFAQITDYFRRRVEWMETSDGIAQAALKSAEGVEF